MTIFKSLVRAAAVLSIAVSTYGYAAGIERPFEKAADKFYQMLVEKKFDELERIANESQQQNKSISDGQPQLAALFGGVAGCLTNGCQNWLSETQWQDRYRLILAWKEKYPKSIPAEVAHASFFIEHGWAIRGQGYADSVKEDAWLPFRESMERARKILELSSPAAKNSPGWHSAMLSVGLAQGWPVEQFDKVYRAGIEKHPLYLPLYFNASAYFAPRWHGSPTELRQFVEGAVHATRAQLGETLYARLNWSLWTREMFANSQTDWGRMKNGFERIIADFPDTWNINNYAKFACLAGDMTTLLKLAKKIGDQPLESAWWGSKQYYDRCVAMARDSQPEKVREAANRKADAGTVR